MSEATIRRSMKLGGKRKPGQTDKYKARKVPKQTPLRTGDSEKRLAYAEHGPIARGGKFGDVYLSEDWEQRKKQIGFIDDKPFWLDSSTVKNRFYYDFGDYSDDEPPEVLSVEKHSPHFMNCCGICYSSKFMHEYSHEVKNKRRTRNSDGVLVRGSHYEHDTVDAKLVLKVFKEEVIPWCKDNGLLLLIVDNDTKFHSKMLVTECKAHGIEIYPGSGKRVWDRADNGYPPRSHDCMPCETEFANAFEEAQLDLERRERNAKKKRTMKMWRNSIRKVWFSRPIEEVQKLIDRQPKIQQEIIKKGGRRTKY